MSMCPECGKLTEEVTIVGYDFRLQSDYRRPGLACSVCNWYQVKDGCACGNRLWSECPRCNDGIYNGKECSVCLGTGRVTESLLLLDDIFKAWEQTDIGFRSMVCDYYKALHDALEARARQGEKEGK